MPERHPVLRQVYVTGAVLAFVGVFMPTFADEPGHEGFDYTTPSLVTLVGEDGGGAALLGILVVLAMVATALRAAGGRRAFGPPSGVLALACVAVLMLLLKPGTAGSTPSLGAGGGLLLGTALVLAGAALVDVLSTPYRGSVTPTPPVTMKWP